MIPHPPGEIDDQLIRIENARAQIELNGIEITNLHEEIAIEITRTSNLQGINRLVSSVKIGYLGRQRSLDRQIADIEAAQALQDDFADILDITVFFNHRFFARE